MKPTVDTAPSNPSYLVPGSDRIGWVYAYCLVLATCLVMGIGTYAAQVSTPDLLKDDVGQVVSYLVKVDLRTLVVAAQL